MNTIVQNIELFKNVFVREYGEKKLRDISNKIYNSNKVMKIFDQTRKNGIIPNHNDFLFSLNEIPYFMFSKADTLAMGSIVALELWNNTFNKDYLTLDDYNLNQIFWGIINGSRCNLIKI